jgi:hypothetical protein
MLRQHAVVQAYAVTICANGRTVKIGELEKGYPASCDFVSSVDKEDDSPDMDKEDDSPENANMSGHEFPLDVPAADSASEAATLNVSSAVTAKLAIDLQGLQPSAHAAIRASINDAVDLRAWTLDPVVATSSVMLDQQSSASITNGSLTGNARTATTINVSAYLPANDASVDLHVTDTLDLNISGKGYTEVALGTVSEATSTVQRDTSNSPSGTPAATFDLAKFAAVVLGTTQWDISFAPSLPGESLHIDGHSVRIIDAEADILANVPGKDVSPPLVFHSEDRTSFSFNEYAGPAITAHGSPHDTAPVSITAHYDLGHILN